MPFRDALSKDRLVSGVKSLGKLRVKVNHSSIISLSALLLVLFVAFTIRTFPVRWEIQSGALHLTEFDPYFQFRFTDYIVKNGFLAWAWPTQWVDTQRWYPAGINVARAGYPGLPMTAAFLYKVVTGLGVNIELMEFAALLAPFMGALAVLAMYFLGRDVGGKHVGLIAALFLALNPSYIQRSSLGWFDDEITGMVSLLLFAFLFLRAIEEERALISTFKYAIASGLVLGYFTTAWGASYYPIGLITLFVFILVLLKRYTQRVLLSYSVTFGLGFLIAINVPKLTTEYLFTDAILPVAGVFVLLCLSEVFRVAPSTKWKVISVVAFLALIVGGFVVLWQLGYTQGIAGKFISVINPFTRAASPLVESVAEHRISAWGSIYYEFGIAILFFVAGMFFLLRNLNNRNLFLLVFGLTSLYFATSMVRLFVIMAPAFGLLAAVGVVGLLKPFATLLKEPPKIGLKKMGAERVGREYSGVAVLLIFLILTTNLAFPMPRVYMQAYSPVTITAGSISVTPTEPVREWLDMFQYTSNLPSSSSTVVVSWWDYGYWLTVLGNVTTIADNATINGTQIENLGYLFMSNETQALKMLKLYDAQYILVFVTIDANGNMRDELGGDNGKWMWMARISAKASDRFKNDPYIREQNPWVNETTSGNGFGQFNQTSGAWEWNARGVNSLVYKLMNFGKDRWVEKQLSGGPSTIELTYFKEAYFAGLTLKASDSSSKYRGVVPLVCLYKIDWDRYQRDYPTG